MDGGVFGWWEEERVGLVGVERAAEGGLGVLCSMGDLRGACGGIEGGWKGGWGG